MKLLLVEDEEDIAKPLMRFLHKKGYTIDWVEEGTQAIKNLKLQSYDCCLLDLNLPGIDGLEVMRMIRQDLHQDIPVIMVTARSQLYDKLEGFDGGADDYLTKPFHLEEIAARIEALIRRSSHNKQVTLKIGPWTVDPDRLVCIEGSREVELSNKEMTLLVYLSRNAGRTVSAEELLEHVWDSSTDMFSDTVKTHIKTLRKKIDPDKTLISTIKGKGYRVDSSFT